MSVETLTYGDHPAQLGRLHRPRGESRGVVVAARTGAGHRGGLPGDDVVVPLAQSAGYVAAAVAAGAEAELVEIDGDNFTVIDTASDAWSRTVGVLDELARG